jgi:membrane protein implicated in regulation of membrane protease activity
MSDPYDDVPKPLGAMMIGPLNIGCFLVIIPVIALAVAIFALHWPWWGDVLAPIVTVVVLAGGARLHEDQQREAWIRRHPEVMKKPPSLS